MRTALLVSIAALAAQPAVTSAASPSRPRTLELVVYGTIKPPEVVGRCVASALKAQLKPLSDSPANDGWEVNFHFRDVPASVLIAAASRGTTVAYPRQVAIENKAVAAAIEDCG
jgi:hypothetical protein